MTIDPGKRFIVAAPVVDTMDECRRLLEDYVAQHVGGIMVGVGGRHPLLERAGVIDLERTARLIEEIRAADSEIMIAVDAEGGSIFNILEHHSPLKSAAHYTQRAQPAAERFEADVRAHARLLRELGVTMNFAPLLDVALPSYVGYPAADGRSYGDGVEIVVDYARRFISIMGEYGITAVAKHFPGYGALTGNPHRTLTTPPTRYEATGLAPYRRLADGGLPAVMTGHVPWSASEGLPASLSRASLRALRDDIGFSGLVVADELFMGAVTESLVAAGHGEDPDGAVRAVAALQANDVVIVSYPIQNADGTITGLPGGAVRFPAMRRAAVEAVERGVELAPYRPLSPTTGDPDGTPAP